MSKNTLNGHAESLQRLFQREWRRTQIRRYITTLHATQIEPAAYNSQEGQDEMNPPSPLEKITAIQREYSDTILLAMECAHAEICEMGTPPTLQQAAAAENQIDQLIQKARRTAEAKMAALEMEPDLITAIIEDANMAVFFHRAVNTK